MLIANTWKNSIICRPVVSESKFSLGRIQQLVDVFARLQKRKGCTPVEFAAALALRSDKYGSVNKVMVDDVVTDTCLCRHQWSRPVQPKTLPVVVIFSSKWTRCTDEFTERSKVDTNCGLDVDDVCTRPLCYDLLKREKNMNLRVQ
jgi:hypothetical protein